MTLKKLYRIIKDRKKELPENSYIAALFIAGNDRIIQKVGEEAIEVVIAAKNEGNKRIIEEVADLWFHTLILLASYNISPEAILEELDKRKK